MGFRSKQRKNALLFTTHASGGRINGRHTSVGIMFFTHRERAYLATSDAPFYPLPPLLFFYFFCFELEKIFHFGKYRRVQKYVLDLIGTLGISSRWEEFERPLISFPTAHLTKTLVKWAVHA
jgi:hypothetical protein